MTVVPEPPQLTPGLTRAEVREIDRRAIEEYGLPGIVLMENAGRGAAELLLRRGERGPVAICCGGGNNGGDGFVIARHLDAAGCDVRLLLTVPIESLTGDARINADVTLRSGLSLELIGPQPVPVELDQWLAGCAWIVDALLGTGTRGQIREPYEAMIAAINRARALVLAVDLPSGLDADEGRPLGACVEADVTATFVAPKRGFAQATAAPFLGTVQVVDIGIPSALLAEFGVRLSRVS